MAKAKAHTPPTQTETAAERERRERQAIFARCARFLSGHGLTRPKQALAALAEATGEEEESDRYGEGALIADFEREVAALLGKEAAVFLPSGTMAQQIALRVWSERTGRATVAFHPTCHLELHEQRGYARLHGLHARLVGDPLQLLTLSDLEGVAEPVAALLIELPQRELGGLLPSWEELSAQAAWARARGAAAHLDGARLWESAPFYGKSYAEIAALFDTVYVSFYKGVGALAGAALAGPADFIAEARIWQRRHGGNLIHLYPYVLSARLNLRRRLPRFPAYHAQALRVAAVLAAIPGISLAPNPPHAHMMHVYLRGDRERLLAESLAIAREERVALFQGLMATDVPETWKFELTVGDAAEALGDDELRAFFTRIARAGQER
ncbi:MAG TPA: beta-eliminating lyase-related protein [Ktedonobacterales bacterium]